MSDDLKAAARKLVEWTDSQSTDDACDHVPVSIIHAARSVAIAYLARLDVDEQIAGAKIAELSVAEWCDYWREGNIQCLCDCFGQSDMRDELATASESIRDLIRVLGIEPKGGA